MRSALAPPSNRICPPSQVRTDARLNIASLLLAALLLGVWAVSLSRSVFDPLGDDQALFQFITDRVIAGQKMYVDVWEQNLPGIVAIHWLSSKLFGQTAIAFRCFDACWQALTLLALILIGYRAQKRWIGGILAALLYALAYYGLGYMQTGQREDFAVLLLLVAVHAVARPHSEREGGFVSVGLPYLVAGVMGCLVFMIKSPLGLCYGCLWCWTLAEAWKHRDQGRRAWAGLLGLTGGFVFAFLAVAALLVHLGWWHEFWRVLIRADMHDYAGGPDMIRSLIPELMIGALLIVILTGAGWLSRGFSWNSDTWRRLAWVPTCILAYVLLMTVYRWPLWRVFIVAPCMGLLLPAAGSIFSRGWTDRSRIGRICIMLAAAAMIALFIQGRFSPYQATPFLAFAAVLAAEELVAQWPRLNLGLREGAWATVCLAAVMQMAVGLWGWSMTAFSREPYVLASMTLDEHYDRVTKHKLKYARHQTTAKVAQRVQELTNDHDPILLLFHDPRVFYYCQRPPVCRFMLILGEFRHKFPEIMDTTRERKPKVVLARTPQSCLGSDNLVAIQSAVFDEAEAVFGSAGHVIREHYRLTERIGEICLLQPVGATALLANTGPLERSADKGTQ